MGPPDRLNSWKEIAAYLNVSVRTVQRWEQTESLPAHRHKHTALSSVFAYRSELDFWWNSRPDLKCRLGSSPAAAPRSIAVLPFVNLSPVQDNEILSDGLTEELINALTEVEGLQVTARTSAFHFKGRSADIRTIGSRLGVRTILEGSVRRAGDRLRITAQLINVADGYQIWSKRFDRRMTDLFALQEEIASAIVSALRLKLDCDRITRQLSRDPEIYSLYLEGRYHSNRRTRQGFLRAVECFEQVLARDPGMAAAWSGLADCHAFLGPLAGISPDEALQKAKHAALRALEIDSSLADPHCSLGFITAVYEYDWPAAENHFRRALECNPDHAPSHIWYSGHVLAPLSRLHEAGIYAMRACQLDPLSPPARSCLVAMALVLRQPDRAISESKKALEVDPAYPWTLRWLGEAWLLRDKFDDAAEAFSRIQIPVVAAGFLGYCYARSGRETESRHLLRNLEHTSNPSPALQVAIVHLGLGDKDAALDWLHQACEERSMGVHWLNVEPIWDPLRSDPRFRRVLNKMRLVG